MNKERRTKNAFMMLIAMIVVILIPGYSMAYEEDSEVDLIEPTNEDDCMTLYDIYVGSQLIDTQTVELTLENEGAFEISEWAVAYEADYVVLSADGAEIVSDREVIELKCIDSNQTISAGESISIHLTISGDYSDDSIYRVYGICGGLSEAYSVADFITYDSDTGEITLSTYDVDEENAVSEISLMTKSSDTDSSDSVSVVSNSSRVIIGSDGRTKVTAVDSTPYCRIACLIITWTDGSKSQGTGFMISSKYMLTAAHCVYNTELGKTAASITAYFGADGTTYTKSFTAKSWSYSASYPSNTSAKNDWGCIKLSSAPGRGYFSIGSTSTSTLEKTRLTVCGYPGDKAVSSSSAAINGKTRYMYKMSGVPTEVSTYIIKYTIDTYGGQSGSPVYNSPYVVYGIHCKGNSDSGYNSARRFTSSLIEAFVENGWCSY